MPEDGILLSIVNKDLDKDVICVATEKAFLGRLNGSNLDSKYSDNSLIQLTNLSGYLVYQLTKHYLESALSSLKSSCPANLCIERSVISPLVEPAAHEIDENFFTTTDVVVQRGPDPAFQLQLTKDSQCHSEAHLPSGNIKDGSQIITSSMNAESVTDLGGKAVSPREGTFKPADPPANKIFAVIPSIYKVFGYQTALQYDSLAAQPVSLVANIGNDNPKPCSSDGEHILPEEGSRCATDKAEDVLENRQDGTVEKYFEDQAVGTETDMSGNEDGIVHRKCLSGDVHGESFCDIALSSSENLEQDDVIPFNPGSNFTCTTAETSFYEFNHMSDDEKIPILNSEGHALSISGETQQVSCGNTGLASKLLGDGLCVMGTRSVRFIGASVIDTATETDADPATEDPVIGTETDMSGNDSCVRNTCLSGDVHGESLCNVSLNRSEKPEQEDVIQFNGGSNCTAVEVRFFESDHMRDNEKTSKLNSEGHSLSVSGEAQHIPCVNTGLSEELMTDGLCVTETRNGRFTCAPVIDTVTDTLDSSTEVITDMCFKISESSSNSNDSLMTLGTVEEFEEDRSSCMVETSVEDNTKSFSKSSVAVETCGRPEQGGTTDVCSTGEGGRTKILSLSLSIEQQLHRVNHDHFSYTKSAKITSSQTKHFVLQKTEWKQEALLKCYPCKIIHPTRKKLLKHIKNKHLKTGPVVCEVCKKEMKTPRDFHQHQVRHSRKRPYYCRICKKSFATPVALDIHKKTHNINLVKSFTCVICGLVLSKKSEMTKHKKTHRKYQKVRNNPLECGVCGKCLSNRQTLEFHMRAHRGETPYACSICNKAFTRHSTLKIHILTHYHASHRPYSCNKCKETFWLPGLLRNHERFHTGEKPYTCETCGKSFVLRKQLTRHISTHADGKPFACDVCSKRFRLPDQLKKHKVMHAAGKPFMCDRCGKTFKRRSDLKSHEDSIHAYTLTPPNSQPSLECGVCGKCLSNRKSLEIHMRGHRGETPFVCSICNKAFTLHSYLKTHMWTHSHESSKSYSCEICNKTFREACLLRNHIRFHTGEKPYSCETCGKSFVLPWQLKRHANVHVDGKPFACNVCNKRFRLPYNLKLHKATHTGEKPFMCDRCGKVFRNVSCLKYHARSKRACTPSTATEKNVNQCKETVSQSSLSSQDVVSLPAKAWNCDVCGKTFRSKTTLTRHIRTHAKS